METTQLEGAEVANFLRGAGSVRDGFLTSLAIHPAEVEWEPILELTFDVPGAPKGAHYRLEMKGGLEFEHTFSSTGLLAPIPFVKCLWSADAKFYLSLDPYDEREDFVSPDDGDYFKADWVRLTVSDDAR